MLSNPSPKPNPKPNPELKPTPKPTPTPTPKPKPKQVAARNAVEAHEAKTGRVTSTVDRKDAAPQAKLLFQKALAMVEANHGRSDGLTLTLALTLTRSERDGLTLPLTLTRTQVGARWSSRRTSSGSRAHRAPARARCHAAQHGTLAPTLTLTLTPNPNQAH